MAPHVLPTLKLQAEWFWITTFVAAIGWHFLLAQLTKQYYKYGSIEKELVCGGLVAIFFFVSIAFHNRLAFLPFDFSPVADVVVLGWIAIFWTLATCLIAWRTISMALRLKPPKD